MADTLHVLTCTCLGTLVYLGYMYLLYKSTYVAVPLEYIQGPSITVEKHVSMGNENWATYTWAGKCVPPPPLVLQGTSSTCLPETRNKSDS